VTLIATDGYDMYNGTGSNTGLAAKWGDYFNYNGGPAMNSGRFGGQCMTVSDNNLYTGGKFRNLQSSYSTCTIGHAFRVSNVGSNSGAPRFIFLMNGALVCGVGINTNGSLTAYRLSTTSGTFSHLSGQTALGTSALGLISSNSWYYLEHSLTISATVGVYNVYLDGNPIISVSGANTGNGQTTINQFSTWSDGANTTINTDIDDWHENDSLTPIGPMRIDTLRPTSDSAVQFTPNSGANNYSRVNETLVDGDTSYVSDSTVGHSDLYGLGSLPITPVSIYGVQCVDFAEKTDANVRAFYQQIKTGASLSQGAMQYLYSNYQRYERMVLQDPNTSAAWSAAGVNGMLRGPAVAL
jgi:hypothetical protein